MVGVYGKTLASLLSENTRPATQKCSRRRVHLPSFLEKKICQMPQLVWTSGVECLCRFRVIIFLSPPSPPREKTHEPGLFSIVLARVEPLVLGYIKYCTVTYFTVQGSCVDLPAPQSVTICNGRQKTVPSSFVGKGARIDLSEAFRKL